MEKNERDITEVCSRPPSQKEAVSETLGSTVDDGERVFNI